MQHQRYRVRQQEVRRVMLRVSLTDWWSSCLSPGREWTYHQRQGAKNILQQVKLTVKPQDKIGFLKIDHGKDNNGICQVSWHSNIVTGWHGDHGDHGARETLAVPSSHVSEVSTPSSEQLVTPSAVKRTTAKCSAGLGAGVTSHRSGTWIYEYMSTWIRLVHEYNITKLSSIKSYFKQVEYYYQWIGENMVSATFCNGGPFARN